jgi:hypothetical protein
MIVTVVGIRGRLLRAGNRRDERGRAGCGVPQKIAPADRIFGGIRHLPLLRTDISDLPPLIGRILHLLAALGSKFSAAWVEKSSVNCELSTVDYSRVRKRGATPFDPRRRTAGFV